MTSWTKARIAGWVSTALAFFSLGAAAGQERLTWNPREYLARGYRNAPWSRDPFFPESDTLTVSGVISRELAFMGGRWVKPGDRVEGYVVRRIGPEGVLLRKGSEERLIQLKERP